MADVSGVHDESGAAFVTRAADSNLIQRTELGFDENGRHDESGAEDRANASKSDRNERPRTLPPPRAAVSDPLDNSLEVTAAAEKKKRKKRKERLNDADTAAHALETATEAVGRPLPRFRLRVGRTRPARFVLLSNVKTFTKALVCLSRLGEILQLEPDPDGLVAKAYNGSRSASGRFFFSRSFFHEFDVGEHQADRSFSGNICRVDMKKALTIMRTSLLGERSVYGCAITLEPERDVICFTLILNFDVLREYEMPMLDAATYTTTVDRSNMPNTLSIAPELLAEVIEHTMSGTTEILLKADASGLSASNYIESYHEDQTTQEMKLDASIFVHFDVPVACEMAFNMKWFRALVTFCNDFSAPVKMYFEGAGKPVFFVLSSDSGMSLEMILPTIITEGSDSQQAADHPPRLPLQQNRTANVYTGEISVTVEELQQITITQLQRSSAEALDLSGNTGLRLPKTERPSTPHDLMTECTNSRPPPRDEAPPEDAIEGFGDNAWNDNGFISGYAQEGETAREQNGSRGEGRTRTPVELVELTAAERSGLAEEEEHPEGASEAEVLNTSRPAAEEEPLFAVPMRPAYKKRQSNIRSPTQQAADAARSFVATQALERAQVSEKNTPRLKKTQRRGETAINTPTGEGDLPFHSLGLRLRNLPKGKHKFRDILLSGHATQHESQLFCIAEDSKRRRSEGVGSKEVTVLAFDSDGEDEDVDMENERSGT